MIKVKNRHINLRLCFILSSFFLLFIFSLNNVSSACYVETSASTCTSNGDDVVMRLSSATNAHGAWANQSYSNVLCCDRSGSGALTCGAGDVSKILGLSSATNAHAERPESTNYAYKVCYDGLRNCGFVNTTLASDEIEVIGISSATNAHLANAAFYKSITNNKRIICAVSATQSQCVLSNARWSVTQTLAGTSVTMTVDGANCDGKQISFEVKRGSSSCSQITGCTPPTGTETFGSGSTSVSKTWTAGPVSDTEYSFTATEVINPTITATSPANLLVSGAPSFCSVPETQPSFCSDYTNQNDCTAAPAGICEPEINADALLQASVSSSIDCSDSGTSCYCAWDSQNTECKGAASMIPEVTLTSITVQPKTATANAGVNTDFVVVAHYDDGSEIDNPAGLTCTSSNPNIAAKAAGFDCRFLAGSVGQTTITASYGEEGVTKIDTATLTVISQSSPPIRSHIILDPAIKIIGIGSAQPYSSTLHWSDGTTDDVTAGTAFASSNTSVATVSGNAATGVNAGSTNITGVHIGGGTTFTYNASLDVSPNPPTLTSISLQPPNVLINVGLSFNFNVIAFYDGGNSINVGTNAGLTCTSSNENIASKVTGSKCNFTANSLGETTITASYVEDGATKQDTATITVTSQTVRSHIQLDPITKTMKKGKQQTYTSTLHWSNGTANDVTAQTTFASSNISIATVSGNTATGIKAGLTNITGAHSAGGTNFNAEAFLAVSSGGGNFNASFSGTCFYTPDTTDTCEDDGYLTVVWNTRWEGSLGTPEALQCESENNKEDIVACPAQIPLPFFGIYNLIISIVLIAAIYLISYSRKARKE